MRSSVLIAFGIFVARVITAQDYEIRLHRPEPVGAKTKLSISGKDRQEMSGWSGTKKLKEEIKELAVELEGTATVLETSPNGNHKRISLQVDKLVTTEGGIQRELLPRSTVVLAARKDGKKVFEVNDQTAHPDVAQALAVVIPIESDDYMGDELFGTRERKRVGDSWDINQTAAREILSNSNIKIENFFGKVTLKNVLQDAAGTRLLVTIDVTAKVAPAAPGSSAASGTMTFKGTTELPTDPSPSQATETIDMGFSLRSQYKPDPNGPEVEIRMDMKRTSNSKFIAVE